MGLMSPFNILLTFSIFLKWIYQVEGEDGCRDLPYLDCIKNKTLLSHVIDTFKVTTPILENCQNKCFHNNKCISYNLGQVDGMTRLCELNAADHSSRPTFFVDKIGHEYCPIENPCLSNPCPKGRFCRPDFDWNTPSCIDGAWTQWGEWSGVRGVGLPDVYTRTRTCNNPAPLPNGLSCDGHDTETKPCIPLVQVNISDCASPLGMENGAIKDSQIKQSTYYENDSLFHGRNGRLNKKKIEGKAIGGWAAGFKRLNDYLQVDLGGPKVITMVATQGRQDASQWVTKYSLSYSNDRSKWTYYELGCTQIFPGNFDRNTIVTNKLTVPIRARHIRVIVKGYKLHPTMRVEFYGCSQ